MDEGPRELEIETDPEMNLLQEIRKGHLKITSSNTEVAMVNGLGITPIKEGNATISVAYDDRVFDSIDIELLPGLSGHGWEENDPFLASEALARCKELEPKADDVKDCFIKGVITKVDTPFDAGYKNISFTIADSLDAAEGLLVYRLNTTAEEAEKLVRGCELKITGKLTHYQSSAGKSTFETKAGATVVEIIKEAEPEPPVTDHGYTQEDPFLASEALAKCKELAEGDVDLHPSFIKGVITKIDTPYDSGYKNISIVLADSEDAEEGLLIYRLKTNDEEAAKLIKGAEILITATLKHYVNSSGTSIYETNSGGTVIEIIKEAEPEPPVTAHGYVEEDPFKASEALEVAKALAAGASDENPAFIQGVITKVDTEFSSQYNNISFTIADKVDDEEGLLIYRLPCTEEQAAKLIVGAEVFVKATLKHYAPASGDPIYETNSGGVLLAINGEDPTPDPEVPVIDIIHSGTSIEDAYTADEAAQVMKNWEATETKVGEEEVFVSGKATKVSFNSKYSSYTIDLECQLGVFQLYSVGMDAEAGDYSANPNDLVGKIVTIKGYLEYFVKGEDIKFEVAYLSATLSPTGEAYTPQVVKVEDGEDPEPPVDPEIEIIHSGTSIEDAYTADEAAQVMKNWGATATTVGEAEVYVTGKATSVSFNSKYSSYTIDLECQLGVFQLYSVGMDAEAGDFSENPEALIGLTVTIKGYLEYFVKGEDIKFEVAYLSATLSPTGAAYTPQIVKVEGQEEPPSVEHGYDQTDPFLASEALAKCKELEGGKADEKVAYIKGVITKVETAFNPTYNNISLVLADDVDAEEGLLLYRLSCTEEEAAKLIKGAEIFVSATLKHFVKNEQSIFETNAGGALIEITKEAEAPVEPEVRPDPVEASIAELNAMEGEIKDKTFLVTGVIEAMKNDKFGNAYLTDPVSGETIMLYGATTTETAIAYADGSFTFTNPKDAETTLAGIENGMSVTMEVMFKLYNTTPEIFGIVKESSEYPFPYSVVVEENEDGVITPSKAAEVEYGEEITLAVEPAEGKKLKSLVVENAQGVKKDITEALKFNATCVNKVVATFEDAGAVLTQTLVDADKLGITGSYSDSAEAAKIDGADWMFKECMKSGTGAIQTRYKNSKASEVYNTTALAADVASVTFVFSADQTQTKDLLYVVAGAESVAEAGQSDANAMKLTWDGTEEGRTVTIEIPANLNARFLKLGHTTTSGAAYIQSVTINYRA